MCSIMGFSRKTLTPEEIRPYFDRTLSRGPDMSRIVETPNGYLCFHRLAIMGLTEAGMQPFQLGGDYVVCNGELYGFRPLKRQLEQAKQDVLDLTAHVHLADETIRQMEKLVEACRDE